LIEGIDLETSTLGDRAKKWIPHLEGLECEIHVEEARKGVLMKEEDPREKPHLCLRSSVAGEKSWERRSGGRTVQGERKMKVGEGKMVQGFKYCWTRRTEHCPVGADNVRWTVSVRKTLKRKIFK
jgi:hypothetical protein